MKKSKLFVKWFAILLLSLVFSSCLPQETPTVLGSTTDVVNLVPDFLGIATAQTISANKVKVTWVPSADPKVIAYNIYDASVFFNPVLIKTVVAPASEATLLNLVTQKYYAILIKAAKIKPGSSSIAASYDEDLNTKLLGAIPYAGVLPAVVASSTSAMIPFNSGSDADSIKVYCKTNLNPFYSLYKTVTNVSQTQTTISGLTAGVEYTCRVALVVSSFEDNNTVETVFTPIGQATTLAFLTQPTSSTAGVNLPGQPVVVIRDSNANVVSAGPDATAVITLSMSVASPTLGTLRGTASVAAIGGIATFTGINFQEAGVKILSATKNDTSALVYGSGVLATDSGSFLISAGSVSATKSLIAISPAVPPNAALVANGNNAYAVSITLKDQYDNPISGIKPAFASSIVGDTLSQPTVNTNVSGVSSGSISSTIADTTAPFRALRISSPAGLTSVTTLAPFVPGPAAKLAFSTQPINSPAGALGLAAVSVAVQDAQGNTIISGTGADSSITITIGSNLNNAVLTGTSTVMAVNGVATFTDLGISKTQTGYKLVAASGAYTTAYSNTFNVTAGTPRKIIITGPASVLSGQCSTSYSIQLQDNGNNPANAIQNTPLTLSGLGSAVLYASPACSGTPLTSTLTFTSGTNTKTVYLKDLKSEAMALTATDSSAVLTQGTLSINSTPDKVSMSALSVSATPLSVLSGHCSTAIKIIPSGENNVAGPMFTATSFNVTGVSADAKLYSDAACTTQVMDLTNVIYPVTTSAPYEMKLYLKDLRSEVLNLSLSDLSGVITTTSGLQTVTVSPSKINFTGPNAVVAGACSSAFTISLMDELNNPVQASANMSLSILGLGSSVNGKFYTSPSCAGGGSNSSLILPANASSMNIYFKDINAESLSVSISDAAAVLTTSQVISIGVSPSALSMTAPAPGHVKTSVCAGPFKINTLDGVGAITNAISTITVNLSGADVGGAFYNDNQCAGVTTSSVTFLNGENEKQIYYQSHVPSALLTFVATDAANVLTAGQATFALDAAPAWIGTKGTMTDNSNNLLWFRMGVSPVAARVDGPSSAVNLAFNSTKQFLYVVDYNSHRVLKYDYLNKTYIGWIGGFTSPGGIGITGSNLVTPSSAACVATVNGTQTPGWCTGGQSYANGNNSTGNMYFPRGVTDDGTYIYVTQFAGGSVTRYNSTTGAFAGWVGRVSTTPTGIGPGAPAACTSTTSGNQTPGWCMGGANVQVGNKGDGSLANPTVTTNDGTYLYVADTGHVNRYLLSNGSFQGWIGMVSTTSPTGGVAGCTSAGNNARTPGWCMGGTNQTINPRSGVTGGVYTPTSLNIIAGTLYVVEPNFGGVVATYNASTGAFINILSGLSFNWTSPSQMDTDGTKLYFADTNRLVRTDATGLVDGWIGKVSNSSSMSGNTGCSTLVPNANTPGWCIGGSSKNGIDEQSFNQLTGLVYDGAGHILTGQGNNSPAIKIWDATTGAYGGTMTFGGSSPLTWTNDSTSFAQFQGLDDGALGSPAGIYNDGTSLYVTEVLNARVKKVDIATGSVVGWIGGITTAPTGGVDFAACTGATPMGPSPGWCKGSMPNPSALWGSMISSLTNGIFYQPAGITGDDTYIYVTDWAFHRVQKFNKTTGAYVGWIGSIGTSPTGGAAGCVGAAVNTFTPGWCTGGGGAAGSGDGMLANPSGITVVSGNLYVIDTSNHRISSYNATTGAFNGWIGRTNVAPASGCTVGSNGSYNVSQSGWCKGGTSQASAVGDRGGGFYFWAVYRNGITTDGTNLYVANFYSTRIDKISLGGVFLGAVRARQDIYTDTWSTNPATISSWAVSCSYPMGIWMNGTHIYGVNYNACGGTFVAGTAWKMNLSTGTMVGWRGGIYPGGSPSAGDAGCAGATIVTPGWCQGGSPTPGYFMGQGSSTLNSITGDANFIYYTDESANRVTRLPK